MTNYGCADAFPAAQLLTKLLNEDIRAAELKFHMFIQLEFNGSLRELPVSAAQ